jgi:hypothetical protein
MSYKLKRESIRQELVSQLAFYKHGTKKQQKLADNIEALVNTIQCFQCLDTRQSWYFRDMKHRVDGQGDYYTMSCALCSTDDWLRNNLTNDIYGASGIKLFSKENYSGAERFKALEEYAIKVNPELDAQDPVYKKTEKKVLVVKKKTRNIKAEIGNIINKCQEMLRAHYGDVTALASLLSNIEVNISNCENENEQEQILCEELEDNKFMYVKIKNNSTTKTKSILGICEYNQYNLDIDIHSHLLLAENEAAIKLCKNIVNKQAANDIAELSEMF